MLLLLEVVKSVATKLGLKAAEKPLRNMAGNMLEKAASYGTKELRGGRGLDIQKALSPLGELHLRTLPSLKKCNYCVPGTNLEKRLARGDEGINRLDNVCKQHDIDYGCNVRPSMAND